MGGKSPYQKRRMTAVINRGGVIQRLGLVPCNPSRGESVVGPHRHGGLRFYIDGPNRTMDMGGAPIPSSHDTLTKWLHSAPPRSVAFKRFRLQELNEAEPRDEAVESLLVRALISARLERSLLAEYAKVLGWPRVQQWVSDSRMPLTSTCRRGVFGEVLVGQVLESLHELPLVPIWKDRFLITPGQSLPGLDGLALGWTVRN